ncbi:unnamed protein product [Durusdinium trenchii]|uniref:3(4)-beta-glucanase ARB_01444 (Endo-1) n=3 Tax=Durusdinium trenchii TaxID=1381693 RepID=A0ABP0RN84_9DINO
MLVWCMLLLDMASALLDPISVARPDLLTFPSPPSAHHLPPFGIEFEGPKATNKFWANWMVEEGRFMPIHPMPYVLQLGAGEAPNLMVSRSAQPAVAYGDEKSNGVDKIRFYFSPFINEFGLGALESTAQPVVVKESLFGVHLEMRSPNGRILFPIYSGMAYVSGFYEGVTPRITSTRAILAVDFISNGIWRLFNNGGKEFRLYALDPAGHFVDETFQFGLDGRMNKAFEGWIRLAEVQSTNDTEVLDRHAQAVLMDWELEVDYGAVTYSFRTNGSDTPLLHYAYAHHRKILLDPVLANLTSMLAPTKGHMAGVLGDVWQMHVEMSHVAQLGFLPPAPLEESKRSALMENAVEELEWFLFAERWRGAIFRSSYYFSGKGFQKIGALCLLLEDFFGRNHSHTQSCTEILVKGFRCLYIPGEAACGGAPVGSYYESEWGGIASKEGFADAGCRTADFGNACYNDHHFHFGYFVVAGAMLLKLRPEFLADQAFRNYVETLIRDTSNPSAADAFFPRFRSFDWFDLHSWSRGVVPSYDGKDQESTSEELNLLYGIQLWGAMTEQTKVQQLGATMLALCILTVKEFFLMTSENLHHPADFVKNHVTGIFFQNKVDYATWFGSRIEYIHGIQMLPLTPALILARSPRFCKEEWYDTLSKLPLPQNDPWTSIILTGTLAMIKPEEAYQLLSNPSQYVDDGLTRVWAQYWALTAAASYELLTTQTSTRTSTRTTSATSRTATSTVSTTASTATTASTQTGTTTFISTEADDLGSTTDVPTSSSMMASTNSSLSVASSSSAREATTTTSVLSTTPPLSMSSTLEPASTTENSSSLNLSNDTEPTTPTTVVEAVSSTEVPPTVPSTSFRKRPSTSSSGAPEEVLVEPWVGGLEPPWLEPIASSITRAPEAAVPEATGKMEAEASSFAVTSRIALSMLTLLMIT